MQITRREGDPLLRTLIADDESPIRQQLREMLLSFPDVEVLGEAADVTEAIELMRNVPYDLCFLDVELSTKTKLDIEVELSKLPHKPAIILLAQSKSRRGDTSTLDVIDHVYIPLNTKCIERALKRASQHRDSRHIAEALDQYTSRNDTELVVDKAVVPSGDRMILLDVDNVLYAMAKRGYSYIFTGEDHYLVSHSLAELHRRFHRNFFRVHRAYLVNLAHVEALERGEQGSAQILLSDGTLIPLSRRQGRSLRKLLGLL